MQTSGERGLLVHTGGHPADVAQRRVLVVEDDPSIRTTVEEILTLEGYAVETASNGAEALVAVGRDRPSVVLLDMRMPVLDGWGFAQAVADRRAFKIIVMTAAADARRWAQEIGADGYVAKPFEVFELLHVVEQACAPPADR